MAFLIVVSLRRRREPGADEADSIRLFGMSDNYEAMSLGHAE